MKIFGPVPSRRLGISLGINNIPYKICTYSCVYCQIGKAVTMSSERTTFYPPEELCAEVKEALGKLGKPPDYLTIVPDGEPTLDVNLGELIQKLKTLGPPVAVITNASLLPLAAVREELSGADYVSVKIDALRRETWKRIDRPYKSLACGEILEGIRLFRERFTGTLATETMLVGGMNDSPTELAALAEFLAELRPAISYLAVPVRPPAVSTALPPDEDVLNKAFQILSARVSPLEYLTGYEGNAFSATGDPSEDILGITSVHPMRKDAIEALLAKTGDGWDIVAGLIRDDRLRETAYNGHSYYLRKFTK